MIFSYIAMQTSTASSHGSDRLGNVVREFLHLVLHQVVDLGRVEASDALEAAVDLAHVLVDERLDPVLGLLLGEGAVAKSLLQHGVLHLQVLDAQVALVAPLAQRLNFGAETFGLLLQLGRPLLGAFMTGGALVG
jgi:hypothetical protein